MAIRPGNLCRIGFSAVVGGIVATEGLARKPSLLILAQLAYPDRGWRRGIITDDKFSTR
jgi:hypothetical protein